MLYSIGLKDGASAWFKNSFSKQVAAHGPVTTFLSPDNIHLDVVLHLPVLYCWLECYKYYLIVILLIVTIFLLIECVSGCMSSACVLCWSGKGSGGARVNDVLCRTIMAPSGVGVSLPIDQKMWQL